MVRIGDLETATSLIYYAAIVQILVSIIFIIIGVALVGLIVVPLIPLYGLDFLLYAPPFVLLLVFLPLLIFGVIGIIGLYISKMWMKWRHNPAEHKTGLITSGILVLLFLNIISGILTLVAGAIIPSAPEPSIRRFVSTPVKQPVAYCPSCGASIIRGDRFCARCGAAL